MRIAIDAPTVRALSANEKMVYQLLKEGLKPKEIAKKLHIPLGSPDFLRLNCHDVMPDTVVNLITSIREKGWEIPADKKEENQMAKISEEQKREIVQLAMPKAMPHKEIAEKFGIGKSTVWWLVDQYKKSGERVFSEAAEKRDYNDIDAEEIACELHGTPLVSVDCDTDIEAFNEAWEDYRKDKEKEPVTAATDTSSEQNIIPDNSTDIVPENAEKVKPSEEKSEHISTEKLPSVVLDACFLKKEELRTRISEEEQYIRTLYEDLQELERFIKDHGGNDNGV